jgi:transcription elongation factor Elf1
MSKRKPLHVKSLPKCSKCGSENVAIALTDNKKFITEIHCLERGCGHIEGAWIPILKSQ